MNILIRLLALCLPFLAGCGEPVSHAREARILAMGDSLLAWNTASGSSVSAIIEDQLGEQVVDRSVSGARVIYNLPLTGAAGMNIAKQYRPGKWDWIVVNGGGNDLWLGCGCFACNRKMDKLISEDGRTGAIPGMLSALRRTGARVIYVGYLRSPGRGSPIEHCRDEGDELETRISRLAGLDGGLYFLSLKDLVPHGDRSFHAFDMIHPSVKVSAAIGARISGIITSGG